MTRMQGWERVLREFGQDLTITTAQGSTQVKGFLQPVTQREKAVPYQATSLGTVDDRRWICLTRAELHEGDQVSGLGRTYTVQNSARFDLGGEMTHWWAALTPTKEAAD